MRGSLSEPQVLILRVGASGISLFPATIAVLRPFHPPLFIPWNEVVADPVEFRFGWRSGWRSSWSRPSG